MQSKAEPFSKNINGKEDLFSEYMSVMMTADAEEIESFFNKYDFDYICVQYNDRSLLLYLKTSDDYEPIIDENSDENHDAINNSLDDYQNTDDGNNSKVISI